MKCACGSDLEFSNCCEPFIKGTSNPDTAEKLMRSRYTAYTLGDANYVKTTMVKEAQDSFDLAGFQEWVTKSVWKGLKILSTEKGGSSDIKGKVEFTATYEVNGEMIDHHEVSDFKKDKSGKWFFVDGDAHTHRHGEAHGHHHHHHKVETITRSAPKVGRNDPCTCGSGKKYKKCCGA
ncbi:MAG: YchJ family protein [Bacteriovoracaceae bacterium]